MDKEDARPAYEAQHSSSEKFPYRLESCAIEFIKHPGWESEIIREY
jgi:hypothetical protein